MSKLTEALEALRTDDALIQEAISVTQKAAAYIEQKKTRKTLQHLRVFSATEGSCSGERLNSTAPMEPAQVPALPRSSRA